MSNYLKAVDADEYLSEATELPPHSALYILVGIPGAGKSTWASKFLKGVVIASTDQIRRSLHGSLKAAHEAKANTEVFKIFHEQISLELSCGNDVIADATSLQWESRRDLLRIGQRHNADIHLVFFNNVDEAVTRNRLREADEFVPEIVMDGMLHKHRKTVVALITESELYDSVTVIESVT